ncbi:MAG TPA: class I SAM-dependent methyltransferase [Afifellaceae bacterium]|nr:class I SAM-dependent methyltransferase [Afifellaceae bacterium]
MDSAVRLVPVEHHSWLGPRNPILEIGAGHGSLLNALACSHAADRIVGIDIRDYNFYCELFPRFQRIMVDAEELTFDDNEFEVITCMEVIEHLPDGKMERVLGELRRVATKRLIISVPFCEPPPLPKYNSQRFDSERVQQMFPLAS